MLTQIRTSTVANILKYTVSCITTRTNIFKAQQTHNSVLHLTSYTRQPQVTVAPNENLSNCVRFFTLSSLKSTPAFAINWSKKLLRSFTRPSLRHSFQQSLLPQQQRYFSMGSINCKEYTTNNETCADHDMTNGTTGSGSYQSTCGNNMDAEYTEPVAVCYVNDLKENDMKKFDFNEDTKVLVIRQNNKIRAIGNKCTHYGGPLNTGALGDGRVRCPWHGACFNIETGDIEDFPGLDSLPCFKVNVKQDGQVLLRAKHKDLESSKRLKDMVKRDPNNHLCYVVIGGGPSGGVCVETLRQEGFTGRIVMICKEKYLPYDRVKISKNSDIAIDVIEFRKPEFYDEYGIETLMSTEATKVDCATKTVYLSTDFTIKYDKMFIATGCSASKPPIKGVDLKGVAVVREYDDLQQINRMITSESNVVCLGSSFIALESAQSLVKKVKSVTLVSRTAFPLTASFGPVIGERVLRLFRDKGVNMIMSSGIVEAIGDNYNILNEVVLIDGTKLPCDLLILGTGVTFNTKFLIGSGLPINANGSIDTDFYLKSLVDDIYIGGDIANAPVFAYNNERATIGHYQLAQYHGRIAAINMVGRTLQELRAVPFFFTSIFGTSIRYAGYGAYTDIVIEGDMDNLKFVAYFINNQDHVVAVASCNRDPIVAQFAELLSKGKRLRRPDLQNSKYPNGWPDMLKIPINA